MRFFIFFFLLIACLQAFHISDNLSLHSIKERAQKVVKDLKEHLPFHHNDKRDVTPDSIINGIGEVVEKATGWNITDKSKNNNNGQSLSKSSSNSILSYGSPNYIIFSVMLMSFFYLL
ncbi:hypothetical protein K502DRAFT_33934 [Neoconidiobolus thromboides FSU 785]|nr:hypothetical protein K502DRAFT_33934 [Neoconidiobolus thromboides FSU 785]